MVGQLGAPFGRQTLSGSKDGQKSCRKNPLSVDLATDNPHIYDGDPERNSSGMPARPKSIYESMESLSKRTPRVSDVFAVETPDADLPLR